MSQLTRQEALNLLAKGESTSQTLQEQTCWSKIAQEGINLSGINTNIKYVQSDQTIQSVIDNCPVAVGSLKEGFTNSQVINVPPGHEKEFYSLVRNGSDAATDKRNVKVIFEDNPDNEFKIVLHDACDNLDNWPHSSLSLDDTKNFTGTYCFKSVWSAGDITLQRAFSPAIDISEYQGMMIDVETKISEVRQIQFYILSGSVFGRNNIEINKTCGTLRTTLFLPFYSANSNNVLDYSAVTQFRLKFMRTTGYTGDCTVYIDNMRFVRTTPCKTAIMRFDDQLKAHWTQATKYLDEKGWRGCFAISKPGMVEPVSHLSIQQLQSLNTNGHDIINHSLEHTDFRDLTPAEVYSGYMCMQKYLEHYGINKTKQLFIHPGHTTSDVLQKYLTEIGCVSMRNCLNFYPVSPITFVDPDFAIPDELQRFVDSGMGGIAELMMHDITNEANFSAMMDWVEERFSCVILPTEVLRRYPAKYRPVYKKIALSGYPKTLTGHFNLEFWHGQNVLLDPNGTARNVYPCGEFRPFHKVTLVNTAGAAHALTFDPTFTAAGAHDGAANADTLTDSGESWVVGQLIGRTVNNTTDVSSGVITANTATTVTAVLAGGTDDDWDVADNYTITPVGLNQAVAQNERGQFVHDGEGWLKIFVG